MKKTNRITTLFSNKKKDILSVFYTAGFPERDSTATIALALEAAGTDMIEIGIPFSDPVADGPVIQESNKIALDNGMTLALLLAQIREIRKDSKMPVILMGYINPVLQYGYEKFCVDAAAAGVDGLILPDLPLDEYLLDYRKITESNNLMMTFLISPTTSAERIRKIDDATAGFIYAVSSSSTTGVKTGFTGQQLDYFERLRSMKLRNPFLTGFGISDHETFSKASEFGAGAIVGSAFITALKQTTAADNNIKEFVIRLRGESL